VFFAENVAKELLQLALFPVVVWDAFDENGVRTLYETI